MRKKLALIIISLDECFTEKGFSGGGHKVTKNLVIGLIESGLFDIDIFCRELNTEIKGINGIKLITLIDKKTFKKDLEKKLKEKHYDYILSSDILLPFANNLIHSNSSKYKSKTGKNKLIQFVLKFYNSGKIKTQEKNLPKDKAIFTVSESLKKDYVENFNLDEDKVFVCHPAVDILSEFVPPPLKEEVVIGSVASGGFNKGGYLLLFSLSRLPKRCKFKARIIFPKIHKSFFFRFMVKILGLKNRVEILPKQSNMQEFYKSIDCYVLPSLNEAFGLVVTEAASNFKPSLVSSTAGVRELIIEGENGFVFNRTKNPVKNLTKKLVEIVDIYFNNNEKFTEISKNAYVISTRLDWKKFTDRIIYNMVKEK